MRWRTKAIIAAVIVVALFMLVDIVEFSYGITRSNDSDNSCYSYTSGMSYPSSMKTYSLIAVVKPQSSCPNTKLRDKIAKELVDSLRKQKLCHAVSSTTGIETNSSQCPKVIMCNSIEEAKKRRVEFIVVAYVKNWKCWPTPIYKKWQADLMIKGMATYRTDTGERRRDYTIYHYDFTDERQMQGTMHGIFNSQHLINHVADKAVDAVVTKIDEDFSKAVSEYKEKSKEAQETNNCTL